MERVKQRIIETIIQINRTHTLPAYGLLLVGPAGTGKSQIAYAVARILKLPWTTLDMSSINDPEQLTGSSRIYFGLSIAYDPYKRELVDGKTLTTCGGDGGCNVCGGMGPLLGYLPCSPHCKPEVREDNEIHNDYDFFRPVIRVQTSGWRMVIDRAQE